VAGGGSSGGPRASSAAVALAGGGFESGGPAACRYPESVGTGSYRVRRARFASIVWDRD
jgi:hypothetical protein